MLDFEVNIPEPSRRSNDRFVFENDNENAMSKLSSFMASVTTIGWEDKVDYNVSTLFFYATIL